MDEQKPFLYHISGCDGTGKSTLVNALSEATGFPTKHFDKPKDLQDGKKQYFDFIEQLDQNVICDRYHDGEWIYAPLYRGYTGDYLQELEQEIVKRANYLFVYIKADLNEIIRRTRIRGEDFVKEEHFQIVLDKFEDFVKMQSLPYIVINTTNSNTEDNVRKILEYSDVVNQTWNTLRKFYE